MNLKAEELKALIAYYAMIIVESDKMGQTNYRHGEAVPVTHNRLRETIDRMAQFAKELP